MGRWRYREQWIPREEPLPRRVIVQREVGYQGEQLRWRQSPAATGRRLPMKSLRTMWSSTDFVANELTRYASAVMCREARQGIFVLGIPTMVLMAGLALLYHALGLGAAYSYTFGVPALLALHVAISARTISDIKVLYLLGMVLLAVSGLAFVLLAHRYGVFTAT